MKRVQLIIDGQAVDEAHRVIIAHKSALDQLESELTPAEFQFVRQYGSREVNIFLLPREERPLIIRILNPSSEPAAAQEEARLAGNELLRELRQYQCQSVSIRQVGLPESLIAFAEGLWLGNYQFLKYLSNPEKKATHLKTVYLEGVDADSVEELDNLLEAVFQTRNLVNEPQHHLDAVRFAEAAQSLGETFGFSVEIFEKEHIEALRMGGLLAVNRASEVPPRFIVLEWKPSQTRLDKPIVLIGKGVTYDTGGLSIKPSEGMEYMKCDMAGGAAVLGAFIAAARQNLDLHLIGLIPATDNCVGNRAVAPGDVIRMYSGTTVEVVNTDAEGRLLLADALHYAKKFEPVLVLDVATLTGAAVRALGSQTICYMGTAPDEIKQQLEKSGWNTYERLVELPLWKEYGDELKSAVADLRNIGSGNAGMITAGKFLEHFAEFPWLHLDIAGPAYLRTPNGYRPKEGTGVGVRLLYNFLKNLSL